MRLRVSLIISRVNLLQYFHLFPLFFPYMSIHIHVMFHIFVIYFPYMFHINIYIYFLLHICSICFPNFQICFIYIPYFPYFSYIFHIFSIYVSYFSYIFHIFSIYFPYIFHIFHIFFIFFFVFFMTILRSSQFVAAPKAWRWRPRRSAWGETRSPGSFGWLHLEKHRENHGEKMVKNHKKNIGNGKP